MIHSPQGDTARHARLITKMLAVMTLDDAELFIAALEEIKAHGQGVVTIKVYRGHIRFIERTFTDDLRA